MRISDWSSDVCSSDLLGILTTTGDPADEIAALTQGPADLLVVDHYGRDAAYETACRQACRRILAIDDAPGQNGRASCRERVCQNVEMSVVAVALKKKEYITDTL